MNFEEVKELITMLDNSKLAYFEMENKDGYIKIDKSMSRNYVSNKIDNSEINTLNKNSEAVNTISEPVVNTSKAEETVVADKPKEEGVEFIKSPIVGTFYSKSSPDAEPFVKEGDVVHKGDIVCIVEAMKLMNEITAEFDCEIVSVVCEDAKMVEYGQKLFKVKRI
ncbi:acetyl-CoA carboxylase biotin carboxyl carrier protein [Intestinibacter sp.]|uniref:acetyl-CoA carboxylase biotin carboxyl carrier protein n=1 Tax=Intestinibacter sp. TaxID=1965304 RepID=UPI003F1793C2